MSKRRKFQEQENYEYTLYSNELYRAKQLCVVKRYSEASVIYQRVLPEITAQVTDQPEFLPLLCQGYYDLGSEHAANKRYDSALGCYRHILKYDPRNIPALIGCIIGLEAQGKYEEVIPNYIKALEIMPENAGLHVGLARAYAVCNHYGKAVEYYNKALVLNPELEGAKDGLKMVRGIVEKMAFAFIQNKVGDFSRNFSTHTDLRKNTPNNDFALFIFDQFQNKDFEASNIDLQAILNGQPIEGFPHIKSCLSIGRLRQDKDEEYLAEVKKSIEELHSFYTGKNPAFRLLMQQQICSKLNIDVDTLCAMPEVTQESVAQLFERAFADMAYSFDKTWVRRVTLQTPQQGIILN